MFKIILQFGIVIIVLSTTGCSLTSHLGNKSSNSAEPTVAESISVAQLVPNYDTTADRIFIETLDSDSDNDGLSNKQEEVLGSDPNQADTDNDGLSDYEELNYNTDVNNPDSDNDGFSDGQEVRGGYDPNVAGARLQLTPQ